MVYIDDSSHPYIIAKLKGESASIEYVRFKAEANAVIAKDISIEDIFPKPRKPEYQKQEIRDNDNKIDTAPKKPADITYDEAVNANRDGRYDIAIEFFDGLSKREPNYHIAWLNLGYAQREKAVC